MDEFEVIDEIRSRIVVIRGMRVLLDADLAALYGVETKRLLEAVRRNLERFPEDFAFRLDEQESRLLRSQFATSRWERPAQSQNLKSQSVTSSWGGRRTPPYVFTEQGVAMLSSVLRSQRAIAVNIEIMRAFVQLRGVLASNAELARRLDDLEQRYDGQFAAVFEAIRQLMVPPPDPPRRPLGFD